MLKVRGQGINGLKTDTVGKLIIDNARVRVYYDLIAALDTIIRPKGGRSRYNFKASTILQIGSKYSRFMDYQALRLDSISDALVKSGASSMDVLGLFMSFSDKIRFDPLIIKGYPTGQNTVQQEFIFVPYIHQYTEPRPLIEWHLATGKDSVILNAQCHQATCTYRGRKYIAWYTPEIAVSNGPYVFSGLPGLIMKIADTKNQYSFIVTGLEVVQGYDPIYLRREIIKGKVVNVVWDRTKVRKLIKNFCNHPAQVIRNDPRVRYPEETLSKIKPILYNPIELE